MCFFLHICVCCVCRSCSGGVNPLLLVVLHHEYPDPFNFLSAFPAETRSRKNPHSSVLKKKKVSNGKRVSARLAVIKFQLIVLHIFF